ncbi:MAG: hypothetical protein AAFR11_13075 [Pseudomonadota bacterium]
MFGLVKRLLLILLTVIGVAGGAALTLFGFYSADAHCPGGDFTGWYLVALSGAGVFVALGALLALISVIGGKGEAVLRSVYTPILLAAAVAGAPYILKIKAVALALGGFSVCAG